MTSLQPGDVEGALVTYLTANLTGVHVGTMIPNPITPLMVRVTRTGGPKLNIIEERPTVLFECYGEDSVAAFGLAADVWRLVNAAGGTWVGGLWCDEPQPSAPINFPDPTYDTRNRYQFYAPMTFALKEIR